MSEHSPGPVADDETLNLIISDPQSLLAGRILHPGVLAQIDTFGLSVLRDRADNAEFEYTIAELKKNSEQRGKERFFHGICSIPVPTVRVDGKDQFLCVYDTALPAKPNHADIFGPDLAAMATSPMSKGDREKRNRARIKRFIELVGDSFIPAASFRNGVLAAHSRPKQP